MRAPAARVVILLLALAAPGIAGEGPQPAAGELGLEERLERAREILRGVPSPEQQAGLYGPAAVVQEWPGSRCARVA